MNDVLGGLLDFVQSIDPLLRTLLAGVAMMFETSVLLGLVVPGDTVAIVAATAVATPVEFVGLVIALVVGALTGESVGFALGRWFGPRIRSSALGRRIGVHNWDRAERYLARRGGVAVFVSRFLPVLHSLIPLTVGTSPMRYRTFLAWTTPACILWALAYVSVGAAAAGSYRELADRLHYAGYVFVAIIVIFAAAVFAVKKVLQKREERHMRATLDGDGEGPDA
ncbi:DedA family protein [Frigoribacterium sp. 2-23]|uniref:DedA family protein n=1 Tax=Frigoribacterium sp. 2-23 TaxID=3415006 RepID=UPI003C6F6E38